MESAPRFVASILLACAAASGAAAAEIVIASKDLPVDEIERSELRSIFQGKKRLIANEKVDLVVHQGGATHERFLQDQIGISPSQFQILWKRLVFTGQGKPPRVAESGAAAVAIVASNRSTIAYIDESTPHEGVKVLRIVDR